DDDLVVAQLFEIELVAQAGAHRLDQGADFLRAYDPVEARALDVEDLAAQREDRLVLAVAPALGRAAGGIALDEEQLAQSGIALAAVAELARQAGDVEGALAAGQLARLLGGLARGGGVDHFLDDR